MLTRMNNTPVVLALSVSILIHCGLIAGTGSMASGSGTSNTPPGRVAITLTTRVRQFEAKNSVFRKVSHVTMRVSGRFL